MSEIAFPVKKENVEDVALKAYERAIGHIYGLQINRLSLGLDLIKIDTEDLWEPLGFDSMDSFCASPPQAGGLGIQKRMRQVLMQVSQTFIINLEQSIETLQEISWSNLQTIVPIINEENAPNLLSEALMLGTADLREKKKTGELEGGSQPLDATKEKDHTRRRYVTCPNCEARVTVE
tara:strand:- start:206 stop:739 length:534 start_codon:yes stop_codon:yes gene_type:complete